MTLMWHVAFPKEHPLWCYFICIEYQLPLQDFYATCQGYEFSKQEQESAMFEDRGNQARDLSVSLS